MNRAHPTPIGKRVVIFAVLAALLFSGTWLSAPQPAAAVLPGANGLIAFMRFRGDERKIFTMSAKGEKKKKAKQITRQPGDDQYPAWSPDGSKILFERGDDIWVVDGRGGNETNLTNSPEGEQGASWSPQGDKIAFCRGGEIWVMNADGSNQTLLNDDVFASRLDWSPNGDKIVFERIVVGFEIWIIDADGSDPAPVATGGAFSRFDPVWSPDGDKIVFFHNFSLWIVNPDGTGLTQLTSDDGFDITPAWSPDGKKIIFERNGHIMQISATGGPVKQIKTRSASFQPDWQTKPGTGPDSRPGQRDHRRHNNEERARRDPADRRR